jgi:hypothetical protein
MLGWSKKIHVRTSFLTTRSQKTDYAGAWLFGFPYDFGVTVIRHQNADESWRGSSTHFCPSRHSVRGLYSVMRPPWHGVLTLRGLTSSGGARPQNLGGHLRGKLIFWGGGGKIEFLKRHCYLPMPLSQDFCPLPPPRRFAALSKGGDIPRNTAPGGRIS